RSAADQGRGAVRPDQLRPADLPQTPGGGPPEMTEISIEREEILAMLSRPEKWADDLAQTLDSFSSTADGGFASETMGLITQVALEAGQLSADLARAVCASARSAVRDQMRTEEEAMEHIEKIRVRELE